MPLPTAEEFGAALVEPVGTPSVAPRKNIRLPSANEFMAALAEPVSAPTVTPSAGGVPVLPSASGVEIPLPSGPAPTEMGSAARFEFRAPQAPKPLAVPRNVAPMKYPKSPSELAFYQAQEERKRAPAYLTAPGRAAAEQGPVQDIQQRETYSLARWYHQERPKTVAALNAERWKLEDSKKEIEALHAAGKPISQALLTNYEARRRGLEERATELQGLQQRYTQAQQQAGGKPFHSGIYYPEEVARGEGRPGAFGTLLGHVSGAAAADAQVPVILDSLQWQGKVPPPPTIPYRGDVGREQGIKEIAQVRDAIRAYGSRLGDDGKVAPLKAGADLTSDYHRRVVRNLTPFQKKNIGVVRQQLEAERDAQEMAKLGQALNIDIAAAIASEGVGGIIGKLLRGPAKEVLKRVAPRLFVRYVEATAPALAAELQPLSRAALNRLVLRAAPEVAIHTATGAAAGGIAGVTGTVLSGGTFAQSVESGKRGALLGAGFGGGTSAVLSALSGTLRSGWNARTSPRLIEGLLDEARGRGVPQAAIPGLRDRMTQAARAPLAAKGRLIRGIQQEIEGHVTGPAKGQGAPRPPVTAEVIPPEPTPTPPNPRVTPREELVRQAEAGDAQAQTWVDRHEAYDLQQAAPIAMDRNAVTSYVKTWLASPEKLQHDMLQAEAKKNPALAAQLQAAAHTLQQEHQYQWARVNTPENVMEPEIGPPGVSVWRQMTPEAREMLPAPVKHALLLQDAANSARVLDPKASVSPPKLHGPALEKHADEQFAAAQQTTELMVPAQSNEVPAQSQAPEAQIPAQLAPQSAVQSNGRQMDTGTTLALPPVPEPATVPPVEPALAPVTVPVSETPVAAPEAAAAPVLTPEQVRVGRTGAPAIQEAQGAVGQAGAEKVKAADVGRRANLALRQSVEELSPEQKDQVIADLRNRVLVDPSTGLGTWADYLSREGVDHKSAQASIDVDGLGWVNTHFGHEGGDALITRVGEVMREVGLEGNAWHKSGDEFAAQSDTPEALERLIVAARERLENTPVKFTAPDGTVREFKGIRLSHVIDETYKIADKRLESVKEEARAAGLRAPKGERPPGLVETGGVGDVQGRESGGGATVARVAEGVAEAPRAEVAPRAEGVDTSFKAGDETHTARWAVYDVGDLVTSHTDQLNENAAYPKELQPRDRTRQASREQIAEMAQKLDPRLMGENPLAQHGAPIIGLDAAVESGNARTIALRHAYEQGGSAAKQYREWLAKNTKGFGLDPADLQGVERPILVRVRTSDLTPAQRVAFTRTANARETASMGATEQAKADTERLTPAMMNRFDVGDAGEIGAATNRDFVRQFIGSLPTAEQATMRTADGGVSQEGLRRIRNAVFYHAYGDAEALTRLAESVDDPARNITTGMLRAAGMMTDLRARIEKETVYPVDIAGDLAAAVGKIAALRDRGESVTGFLAQQGMFGEDLTPLQRSILVHLDANKRSAKRIAATLADYADLAIKAGNPSSGILFEDIAPPEKATLWQAALDRNREIAQSEPGLFAEESGGAGAAETGAAPAAALRPADRPSTGAKAPARPRAAQAGAKTETPTPTVAPKPAAKPRAKKQALPQEQQRAGDVGHRKSERPDWADELEDVGGKIDADGTVLLYHATTKEKGARIAKEGVLRRPADAPDAYGVYLSSSPKVAGSYGDGTVVPVRVRVEDVALDDAFPGERVDFSVPTKAGVYRPVTVGDAALRQSQSQEQQRAGNPNLPPWLQNLGKKAAQEARAKNLAEKFQLEQRRKQAKERAAERRFREIGKAGAAEQQRQGMLPVLASQETTVLVIPEPSQNTAPGAFKRGGGKQTPPPAGPATPGLPGPRAAPGPAGLPPKREFGGYTDPTTAGLLDRNRATPTQPSFKERLSTGLNRFFRIATREFEDLPNDPDLYEFRDRLRQVARSGRDIARDESVFNLAEVFDGLNPTEAQVVGDHLYLHGMEEDIEDQLAAHLERGGTKANFEPLLPTDPVTGEAWTPARLAQALLDNETDVLASEPVQDAVTRLYVVRNDVWTPYWDVSEAVLGKVRPQAKRSYFRHKIIAYRNAQQLAASGALGPKSKQLLNSAINFGFLKKRTGSTLMYDTDLITAEMDWMSHMILGRMKLELLRHVQDKMDISKRLYLEALDINDDLFVPYLNELTRVFGKEIPQGGEGPAFRERQKAVIKLARLAHEGRLPDAHNQRFAPLIDALRASHQLNVDRAANGFTQRLDLAGDVLDQVPGYVEWLREPGRATGVTERHNAKSRAERKKQIGKEFIEPEDLIPEGYEAWFGAPGTILHDAWSAPEQLQIAIMRQGAEELGIPKEAVERLQNAVNNRRPLIIRSEAARTLNKVMDHDPDSPEAFIAKSLQWLLGQWKATKITFPTRAVGYYLHNGIGDMENFVRATGGDPRAFKEYVGSSNKLLREVFRGGVPAPIVRIYFQQGASANIQTAAERMGTGMGVDILGKYIGRRASKPTRMWNGIKNRLRAPHDLREHTLRLALFRYYYDHLQEHGVPPNFGASDRDEINTLPTNERKAWNLSNDAMVSYDRTTEGGRMMARYVYPFWRWKEGNARTQVGFARNALSGADAKLLALTGRRLAGKSLPFVWSIQAARALALAGGGLLLADAWNKLAAGREDAKMPDDVRHRPHFTFVDPISGKTLTFDRFSPLVEFAANFGLDNVGGYLENINNGWMSPTEAVQDMARTATSGHLTSLGPQWQILTRLSGQQLFPNVFEPRPVMDQAETLFDEFGLGWAWRGYLGRPQKRNTWTKMITGTNVVDAAEGAYYEMRGRADDWMRKAGSPRDKGGSVDQTEQSSAAYWFRQSRRYGDDMSAALNLLKFQAAGGDDQKMANSLKKMEPLSAMPPSERAKMLETLVPEDQERIRQAYYHWASMAAPEFDVSRVRTNDVVRFVTEMRASLSGMGSAPGAIDAYVQKLVEQQRREHPELEEIRTKRLEQDILERVLRKAGG